MNLLALRALHETAVTLSVGGFAVRGLRSLAGARPLAGRLPRVLPHVVDTVLLASAVCLAWLLGLSPLGAPWLLAKLCGLCAYIALGMAALRPRLPWRVRCGAFVAALAAAAWIVSVAVTKRPLGLLAP